MEPLGDSQVTRNISSRMGLVLSACRFPGAAQAHGLLEMQRRTGDRHMLGGKCGQEDCVLPPRVVRSHGNIRWKYFSCTKRRAFLFRFSFPVGILPAVSKRQSQVSLKMHEGISHRTGYPEAEDSQDCSALWFNDVLESLWLLSATYWMTHLRVMYWLQWFQTLHPYHITCCLQREARFSLNQHLRGPSQNSPPSLADSPMILNGYDGMPSLFPGSTLLGLVSSLESQQHWEMVTEWP